MKELNLGKEKVGKLLLNFAIPCVISMLVASLYNIVDQIYIGHIQDIGVFCNAATNVVYPLTLIALAICLLIGDGSASLYSLSLGEGKKDKANKSIGNGIVMQIISLTILTIISLLFKNQILNLFGVTNESYKYAYDYLSVIVLGFPVYMFGQGLNSAIRADGSPKYAMFATTIGAIANIILDPIFIFTLNQGIKGAAVATVIGEAMTAILTIYYILFKSKTFKITKESLKLDKNIVKKISNLGIASLITQLAIVIIIAVANNLVKYLNDPYYGDTIPLAVIGIVMKVFGIVVSICIGISLGGQPIVGYNVGSGNFDRVKETLKDILLSCSIVGIVATIIFEFFSDFIIVIFGNSDNAAYVNYARLCFRIYLGGIFLTCLVKSITIFLQSCGESKESTLLSLSRDVLFFVPAIMLFGLLFGVVGMLYSALIADILSAILAYYLLHKQMLKLSASNVKDIYLNEENINYDKPNKHVVIAISREYGSGGRYVGKLLAQDLHIKLYDKEIIKLLVETGNFSENFVENSEETKTMIGGNEYNVADKLFLAESKIIKKVANEDSCIIIGRCADYILKDRKDIYKIFLYSDIDSETKRVIKYYKVNRKNAYEEVINTNKERAKYYYNYTGNNWHDFNNYDLVLNVDKFGIEKAADIIKSIIEKNNNL